MRWQCNKIYLYKLLNLPEYFNTIDGFLLPMQIFRGITRNGRSAKASNKSFHYFRLAGDRGVFSLNRMAMQELLFYLTEKITHFGAKVLVKGHSDAIRT